MRKTYTAILILLMLSLPLALSNPYVQTASGTWVNQAGKSAIYRFVPAGAGKFILTRSTTALGAEAAAGRAVASRGVLRALGLTGLVVGGAMMVEAHDQQKSACYDFCKNYCEGRTYGMNYNFKYGFGLSDSTCDCRCGRTLQEEKISRTKDFAPYICRRECKYDFRAYRGDCNSDGDCYVKCYDCKKRVWSFKKDKKFYIDPIRYNYY